MYSILLRIQYYYVKIYSLAIGWLLGFFWKSRRQEACRSLESGVVYCEVQDQYLAEDQSREFNVTVTVKMYVCTACFVFIAIRTLISTISSVEIFYDDLGIYDTCIVLSEINRINFYYMSEQGCYKQREYRHLLTIRKSLTVASITLLLADACVSQYLTIQILNILTVTNPSCFYRSIISLIPMVPKSEKLLQKSKKIITPLTHGCDTCIL